MKAVGWPKAHRLGMLTRREQSVAAGSTRPSKAERTKAALRRQRQEISERLRKLARAQAVTRRPRRTRSGSLSKTHGAEGTRKPTVGCVRSWRGLRESGKAPRTGHKRSVHDEPATGVLGVAPVWHEGGSRPRGPRGQGCRQAFRTGRKARSKKRSPERNRIGNVTAVFPSLRLNKLIRTIVLQKKINHSSLCLLCLCSSLDDS